MVTVLTTIRMTTMKMVMVLMADTVRILMIRTAVILVAVSVTHAPRTLIADSARVC